MLTSNILPIGPIQMTAIITDCRTTVETRIVDQTTGNTIRTNYHDNLDLAIDFAEQFQIDRMEFETL